VTEDADTYVDISDTIEIKLEALAQHVSQQAEAAAPWVRERGEQLGQASGEGYAYAEAFKWFRLQDDED
jgi:LmbE family N-acetylglucosaminyl deacetylase